MFAACDPHKRTLHCAEDDRRSLADGIVRCNRRAASLILGLGIVLILTACSHEYVCPDPIGPIVRDDCDEYKTRYESLKVQLGFSIGKLGFSVAGGQEKLRDPSELLQLLLQQTLTLCRDFNSCRVSPTDYRRRREEADRKFTAITAITQQLKAELDATSKRQLISKLIEVITDSATPAASPPNRRHATARRQEFSPGFFRDITSIWFGSRFLPPLPQLPQGVPAVADWSLTVSRGAGATTSYVHLVLWGKVEADDRVYIEISDPKLKGSTSVSSSRDEPKGRASFQFSDAQLHTKGTMTLAYRPGMTGKKHTIGTVDLDPRQRLSRAYLAYLADPVRVDPIEYERPRLIFYTRLEQKTRLTVRCSHNGKSLDAVITGRSHHGAFDLGYLRRHFIPLPIRIPLKGGRTRGTWHQSFAGEKVPDDLFPDEASGSWSCQASANGRPARKMEFTLRTDGTIIPRGKIAPIGPPWWPLKTTVLDNEVERQRERELADSH